MATKGLWKMTKEYTEGYRAGIEEAAALADNFHWVLPMYVDVVRNEASDDAAESVCEQLAEAIRALSLPEEKQE